LQYVRLGATGLKVSRLSLGTLGYGDPKWHEWTLGEEAAKPFFKAALDKGINFFDTADAYSAGVSETVTGNALKDMAKRDDVVIATKVCRPMGPKPNQKGLSRKHIMESIDASLKRLKTDYVDLYVIHRFDPETPVEETLDALNDVVRAGKALYLGASSMYAWQFSKMLTMQRERGFAPFVSMQNLYNLAYREEEREMHPLCVAEGIALTPYSPNARGFLAGNTRSGSETMRGKTDKMTAKMQLGATAEDHAVADRVAEIAKKLGAPMATIALAWVLAQKGMTAPVIGVSKMSHLDDAIRALDVTLDAAQIKFLEEPYRPKPVVAMD
jgi:aryl-alcohol dehydrogenase-like predicted oxidoreductase